MLSLGGVPVIADPAGTVALSNLGWVDHGSVWRYDSATAAWDRVSLSDARSLQL
jgi:hypothetical protein